MFTYCGNNPIAYIDSSGTEYIPGEIHNFVVEHICSKNTNKSSENTYMRYKEPVSKGNNILSYYGFCDFYDTETLEIWEVKRLRGGPTCTFKAASTQLNNYVKNGILKLFTDQEYYIGGTYTTIPAKAFVIPDRDGQGFYAIGYWDAGGGIVFYDYIYIPSPDEMILAGQVCVGIVASICATGTPFAAVPLFV